MWVVLSDLYRAEDRVDKVSKYTRHDHELDEAFQDLKFLFKVCHVPKFEFR